jgi:hypothetical protein
MPSVNTGTDFSTLSRAHFFLSGNSDPSRRSEEIDETRLGRVRPYWQTVPFRLKEDGAGFEPVYVPVRPMEL